MLVLSAKNGVENMSLQLRFVTAASLFDGHDASINIMRRLLQSKGVEVIHLGHNRSAKRLLMLPLVKMLTPLP
jgi:methylmalonyl-CoA mutase cobalamin-binding subunit